MPKFGRVMNPVEAVKSGNFADPFRPRYAVDVQLLDAAGNQTVKTGKDLIEKIGQIRKSVAAVQQQIIAPVVWIGSGTINVAQLMLDTLDVVKELAEQTASHTHSNRGTPTNAGSIRNTGAKAVFLCPSSPGGDISFLTSQAAIATRCKRRSAAFSLLRRSEPP